MGGDVAVISRGERVSQTNTSASCVLKIT